ncbi:MAG: MBL fold metallo-hydrolase [Pseudomonadales bacterium]|nr:MBL fold metallo-hydrolase [Pseudomonadales bacterium]
MPAKDKWWDDVIKSDIASYYKSAAQAKKDNKTGSGPASGKKGTYIWGDRVRILESQQGVKRVSARGVEYWVNDRHLGGDPLLEVYVIDVGQGDGLLVVTPEGHNIMVDGGNTRSFQNGGKNAADFVDWKFFKDYLSDSDRDDTDKAKIHLDAMIATHNDIDHFGGLFDLIDPDDKDRAELDCKGVTSEVVYHAGLSWWFGLTGSGKAKRSLGTITKGSYVKLLGNRTAAVNAVAKLDNPDINTLSGSWGKFIRAATGLKRKSGAPSAITRLSTATHNYLPGFEPENGKCSIRLLGPVETKVNGGPALKKFPDGESKNTNGHSVVLRLDYGERRILLTGDLNTHSQNHIMDHYGAEFLTEFKSDVAKGCHHGSHDVSYRFLEGMRPHCTVISSGDAETHDHPRPNIVAASAITGRRLIDHEKDSLICPLVYITEVARSVAISNVDVMKEYPEPRPKFEAQKPSGANQIHNTEDEMARFRLFLGTRQSSPFHWPRLDSTKVVRGLRYGLINIRTDGKRLFFAQMEESGDDWAITTLSPEQIAAAR